MTTLQAQPITASPSGPLNGRVTVPGDKSISHRALLFSLLAAGRSEIEGLLESADVMATAAAVRALGALVIRHGPGRYSVDGVGIGALMEPTLPLDFGNAGTGARLGLGTVGTHPIACTVIGDASLSRRPMGRVLDPLRQMGAEVIARSGDRLPLTIRGPRTAVPIRYRVPVPSAQVKSAVLIAGLNAPGTTTVHEPVPTRDHTERMLAAYGAEIGREPAPDGEGVLIHLTGQPELAPQRVVVPADPSSAAFLIVAGLIVPHSEITVENVLLNESRTGLLTTLVEMGADLAIANRRTSGGEPIGDVTVRASPLGGVTVPPERAPSMIDEYPVLAVAAAFAEGITHMPGLAELRVKESDRLDATRAGLVANAVACEMGPDWLTVTGRTGRLGGGRVVTHLDHRIAMSFLVMGLAADLPVTVDDAAMIATSFPDFAGLMRGLGAKLADANPVPA